MLSIYMGLQSAVNPFDVIHSGYRCSHLVPDVLTLFGVEVGGLHHRPLVLGHAQAVDVVEAGLPVPANPNNTTSTF